MRSPSKVLAAATQGAADIFLRNGLDPHNTFEKVGLHLESEIDPVAELSLSQYCRLFETASDASGNEHIGLHFGRHFKPKHLGILGYAAISSPTLGAALRNMEVHFPAHQERTSFGMIPDDGILWLSYKIVDERIQERRQDAELSLGMFTNIFRSALGQSWSPLEVRFEHEDNGSRVEHEKTFGAPVVFGRRTNAIAFRREHLDVVMPEHDPYLFSVVEAFLKNRAESAASSSVDFATIVRTEIQLQLGTRLPSFDEIAVVLGLSNVEFQKQLRSHGLVFPDLLKAARQDLAIHYMNDESIPLTEIAYSLGYSELSAFSRAFKTWTGISPMRYRRINVSKRPL